MKYIRKKRVESLLKREISTAIFKEIKDPRINFVSVNYVCLTNDLRVAHVYITLSGKDKEKEEKLEILQNAAKFIRHIIGENIRLKHIPEIKFEINKDEEKRQRILKILKEIEGKNKNDG